MLNREKRLQDLTSEILEKNFPGIDRPVALRIAEWLIDRHADELRAQALERANQDAKSVNEYAWHIVNSLIIVNGAAITAVLAALGTGKVFSPSDEMAWSAVSLLCFSVGVFLAIFAAMQQRTNIANWRDVWEARSRGESPGYFPRGQGPGATARRLMVGCCVAFVLGAVSVSLGIYSGLNTGPAKSAPTVSQP